MRTDPDRARRFEAVVAEVYEPLQRYLRRRSSATDAGDVLSDTLLTVWRRLDDVPVDDPLPWCYGVARRSLANHRRGDSRRERLTERIITHRLPDDGGDPQQRIERLDPTLDAAVRSLTLAEQEIIHLWAWEQLEPREIAIVLDQTPNAVSVALSRSRRKLADRLTVTQMPRQDPAGAGQVRDGDTMELGEEA
ncbi:MAG TPA: sigma-70 family RNA polymerase sigma factor [Ilumatobacter sp.]|nr:sigma-70 family RNA polymerase sigma factor [Ilumatobacter sp.]